MTLILNANVLDYRITRKIPLHNKVDVIAMSKLR